MDLMVACREQYRTECGRAPHPYMLIMLTKKIKWRPNDVIGHGLYLAGNNKLLTTKRLGDIDVKILFTILKRSSMFVVINLSYNNLGDESANAIAEYLSDNSTLQKLNLMCNDITAEGGEVLANALGRNRMLHCLILNGNKIGKKGVLAFAQILQINTGLYELDLGHTDQTIDSIIALAVVLRTSNSTLTNLNIDRPLLRGEEHECITVHMEQLLKTSKTLQEIHLEKYDIRDFGATRLSEALMYNTTLTHLDLSNNRIGEDGVQVLAEAIAMSNCLKILDLGYNRIKDPGAIFLADMLTTNTSIQSLVLVYNCFGSPGILALISVIHRINTTLTSIYIWGNKLLPDAGKAVEDLLQSERLRTSNIDVQPYLVDGNFYLAQLNHHPSRHFYWAPSYGDDVPHFQIYGDGFEQKPGFNLETKALD